MIAEMIKDQLRYLQPSHGRETGVCAYDNPLFTPQASGAKRYAQVPHATGAITLDGGTQNWPGIPAETISSKRVVIGADSGGTEGSFKLCWDEKYLYVLTIVVDPTPLQNTQAPTDLWNGDGIEIFLGAEDVDE